MLFVSSELLPKLSSGISKHGRFSVLADALMSKEDGTAIVNVIAAATIKNGIASMARPKKPQKISIKPQFLERFQYLSLRHLEET